MTALRQLQQGLEAMGLCADERQKKQLLDYLALLVKWNATYNLTAIRQVQKMLAYHILDSLSVVPYLISKFSLLDVGSGGGMPGIPCAIMLPDLQVTLVDASQKKASFLQQTVIELGLDNVTVYAQRVEQLQGMVFESITSRAFSSLSDFVRLTDSVLARQGVWMAMKGVCPDEEIAALPENIVVDRIYPLQVPFVDGARHLIQLSRKEA